MRQPENDGIAGFRRALRAGDDRAIRRAAEPIVERQFQSLLHYCEWLGRERPLVAAQLDGGDLAVHAWQKAQNYLTGPHGDKVRDEEHFRLLLRRAASQYLVDVCRSSEWQKRATKVASEETDDDPLERVVALANPDALDLTETLCHRVLRQLFTDEAGFRVLNKLKNTRHPRHYRASVLYELGEQLYDEATGEATEAGKNEALHLHRRFCHGIGVPGEVQESVEAAVQAEQIPDAERMLPLLVAVLLEIYGVTLIRQNLAVYRYELNQLVQREKERG